MKKIKILAGVAGVGKSTYINQHKKENDIVLSSDQLRIELYGNLEEGNKYNGEVFNELNNRLRQAIKTGDGDIYYDTTAVSRKQRAGLYKQIKKTAELNDYEIEVVLLHKPLEQIKEQNNERTGFARVPDDVIERMYKALQAPRIGVDCDSFQVIAPDFSEYMDELLENLYLSYSVDFWNIVHHTQKKALIFCTVYKCTKLSKEVTKLSTKNTLEKCDIYAIK